MTSEDKNNLLIFLDRVDVKGFKEASVYLALIQKIEQMEVEENGNKANN